MLKIEDILPYFPDFTVINDFKDEICGALEHYSAHIESLRGEMDAATRSAENIKADIENLKTRFITIDANQDCVHCHTTLVTRQFYAFPCQHVFHADCLVTLAKDYFPSTSLRRIVHLQNELIRLSRPIQMSHAGSTSRTLLSAQDGGSENQTNKSSTTSSSLDPSTLLLGGGKKLLAAGDKLRELVVPDILATAVSVVGGGRDTKGRKGIIAQDARDQGKIEKLRQEIDQILAASCVLCEVSPCCHYVFTKGC